MDVMDNMDGMDKMDGAGRMPAVPGMAVPGNGPGGESSPELTLPNGKSYRFEALGFTDEAVELMENFEVIESLPKDAKKLPEGFSPARFSWLVKECLKQSLEDAGHNAADVKAALRSIKMGKGGQATLQAIARTMLGED